VLSRQGAAAGERYAAGGMAIRQSLSPPAREDIGRADKPTGRDDRRTAPGDQRPAIARESIGLRPIKLTGRGDQGPALTERARVAPIRVRL